jgi:uncharacterized protein (DUF2236 family)
MKPSQDPRGLFSPETITWKVHSDPAMAVGGIRALLQQALHPEAMDGVAKNSNFREDAWGRLQRTGDYVSTLTFGDSAMAHALAARVRKIHSTLGLDDPRLLLWVHISMVDSFLDIARRSGLALTDGQADQYISEMVLFAELVGVPTSDIPAGSAISHNSTNADSDSTFYTSRSRMGFAGTTCSKRTSALGA